MCLCVFGCPFLHKTHDREKSMNGDVCWVRCTQTNSHNIIHHLDGKDKSLPQWVDLGGSHGPSLGLSLSLEISVIFDTNSTPVLRGKPKTTVGTDSRRSGSTCWCTYWHDSGSGEAHLGKLGRFLVQFSVLTQRRNDFSPTVLGRITHIMSTKWCVPTSIDA